MANENINTADHWNALWQGEAARGEDREYPDLYPSVIAAVPNGGCVVDVGCGTGYLLQQVREQKQCRVFGIDIAPEAIARMNTQRGIDGVAATVPPIPLPDGHADVTLCTEVLEHITDDHALARELVRITKAGGRVVATVPNHRWGPEENPEHQRTYTAETFAALFPDLVERSVVPVSHYLLFSGTVL